MLPGLAQLFQHLLCGFLFGAVVGTTLTVIAATVGATLLFLAARSALGNLLRDKAGPSINERQRRFH